MERIYYAVVSDGEMYLTRQEAQEALLRDVPEHMRDWTHVVEVRMIPLTEQEQMLNEAYAENERFDEREAREWKAQHDYEQSLRFQL